MHSIAEDGRSLRWAGWRFAAAMAALSVGVGLFVSFCVPDLIQGPSGGWWVADDFWWTTNSAQFVSNGGLAWVYSANPIYAALPGFLVLYAPVVFLADHLNLISGYPYPLPRPTMWELSGPFAFLVSTSAVFGVDHLMETLALPVRRRRLALAAVAVLVVAPTPGIEGHPEDMVALGLSMFALSAALRGRWKVTGWSLCLAVLMQTWAGLLIPVLFAAAPAGRRAITLVRSAALPAVAGVLLLALDWKDASLDLLRQPMPDHTGQLLPWHQLAARIVVNTGNGPTTMLVGSTTRSMAVVVAVLAAWWLHRKPSPTNLIVAAGLALTARVVFEVEYWPYYIAPGAVLLFIAALMAAQHRPKRLATACFGAFALYANSATGYLRYWSNEYTNLAVVIATAGLVLAVALDWQPEPELGPVRWPAYDGSLADVSS